MTTEALQVLIRKYPDQRGQMLCFGAAVLGLSGDQLRYLRVGEVEAWIDRASLKPDVRAWARSFWGSLSKGASSGDLVLKTRIHGGEKPASLVTLWTVLKTGVKSGTKKVLRYLRPLSLGLLLGHGPQLESVRQQAVLETPRPPPAVRALEIHLFGRMQVKKWRDPATGLLYDRPY